MSCLVVWLKIASFSTLLRLNSFGWVVVGDWRMLPGGWWLKPFLILSYATLSMTLTQSLTKHLAFQHTLIVLSVIAISFASCELLFFPYLVVLRPSWSMPLLLAWSLLLGLGWPTCRTDCPPWSCPSFCCTSYWYVLKCTSISGYMHVTLHLLPIQSHICYRIASLVWWCLLVIALVYLQEVCCPA